MDFDHRDRDTKRFAIGNTKLLHISVLLAEVAKCDLVCANCHRIRSYRRRDWTHRVKREQEQLPLLRET